MVHALEEIRRLLKPDGFLIDIHGFPEPTIIKVFQGGEVLYAEPKRLSESEDVLRADEAVAEVVERGLYVIERSDEFDFHSYCSSVSEYRAYWDEIEPYEVDSREEEDLVREAEMSAQVDEIMQAAGAGVELVFDERTRMTRLKPVR